MDINELIAIVKKKLEEKINIESIRIEDKSFLHKNHAGNKKYEEKLKLITLAYTQLKNTYREKIDTRS